MFVGASRPSRSDRHKQSRKDDRAVAKEIHPQSKEERRPAREERKDKENLRPTKQEARPARKEPVKVDSRTVVKRKEQMNEYSQTDIKKGVVDSGQQAPVSIN